MDWEQYLDVFVLDLRTGITQRASTTHDGKMADDDGGVRGVCRELLRRAAPREDAIYVWRRGHGLENLTPGPYDPWSPYGFALSGDGAYLTFTTDSPSISDQDPEDTAGPPQLDLFGVRVR